MNLVVRLMKKSATPSASFSQIKMSRERKTLKRNANMIEELTMIINFFFSQLL